jgi:carboxymethylenebutenolidase
MGTMISFARTDGKSVAGYLAKAARANAPGIVVIQEWWGLQDQIKGICDRLAGAGFDALAPDLYSGKVVPYHDRDEATRLLGAVDFLEATDQVVRGAAQYLAKNGAKVGLTGFCMGGAVTVLGACRLTEFAAAICFYGLPPASAAKPEQIKIPLQGHFASQDDWCSPAVVDSFEADCKAAGKPVEFYRYQAQHAFMNEQRPDAHDRQAAELAWGRSLAFWETHL